MTTRANPDGTIDVLVTMTVQVDPDAWARAMMDEDPAELLQKQVRADVKRRVGELVAEWPRCGESTPVPIRDVRVRGQY